MTIKGTRNAVVCDKNKRIMKMTNRKQCKMKAADSRRRDVRKDKIHCLAKEHTLVKDKKNCSAKYTKWHGM